MSESEAKVIDMTQRGLTLTFGQIANPQFENALTSLSQMNNMPGGTSFRIARLISKLTPEYKVFNERRTELFQKFGEADPNQEGNMRIPPEKIEAFQSEFNPILEEVAVEIPSWKPLTRKDFGVAADSIAPMMFLHLMPLMNIDDNDWDE